MGCGEVMSHMAFSEEHLFLGSSGALRDNPAMQTAILDASHKIAMIYANLLEVGFSEQMVANAMLGATIHFYDAAGIDEEIPALLRQKADLIEREFRSGRRGAH